MCVCVALASCCSPVMSCLAFCRYAVLRARWNLDDGDQLYENPHDASFDWVYDERLHRRLRRYDKACRPFVKSLFLPLASIFLLLAMLDQTLFALWGAHQMTLPKCTDCDMMMDITNAGPDAYLSLIHI